MMLIIIIIIIVDHLPEFGVTTGNSNIEVLEDCQDVVIRWFTTFVQASRNTPTESHTQ